VLNRPVNGVIRSPTAAVIAGTRPLFAQPLKKSFFQGFAVVHVFAALGSHNDGIVDAENEGS
jgi:hypothetical protein